MRGPKANHFVISSEDEGLYAQSSSVTNIVKALLNAFYLFDAQKILF